MATILIIEDDPNTRMFTSINLSTRGHRVLEAKDGREGEEKLIRNNPDLVLLDIRLPEKNGLELLDQMGADPRLSRIPVVIMTASHLNLIDDDWQHRAAVCDVLIKPFKAPRLVEAVTSALRKTGEASRQR
jgi:DNA-binding response OmpR family regulator